MSLENALIICFWKSKTGNIKLLRIVVVSILFQLGGKEKVKFRECEVTVTDRKSC